jgi:imidazolonepropionase-like amidohydrolase
MMLNPQVTILFNVRVFDGHQILPPTIIAFSGPTIISLATQGNFHNAKKIDCKGQILLPGFIDSHIHLSDVKCLQEFRKYGVTTALDMETYPESRIPPLRGEAANGLTDIRSAGLAAYYDRAGSWPPEGEVASHEDALRFVVDRVANGADYIKVIADPSEGMGGLKQEDMISVVEAAHKFGKQVFAHVVNPAGFQIAQNAKVDVFTHSPLVSPQQGHAKETEAIARMFREKSICIPTLIMMKMLGELMHNPDLFENAKTAVKMMHSIGVPMIAGTDANNTRAAPVHPTYGSDFHTELELLVEAGLSPLEALRSATVVPAQYLNLGDRGAISPGMRADLVLLEADPLHDIRNTRKIAKVWCAGKLFEPRK